MFCYSPQPECFVPLSNRNVLFLSPTQPTIRNVLFLSPTQPIIKNVLFLSPTQPIIRNVLFLPPTDVGSGISRSTSIGRGFHALIRNVLFLSPTDVGSGISQVTPHWGPNILVGTRPGV